jgi:hypothetical protein
MTTFRFSTNSNSGSSVSAQNIGATLSKFESGITRYEQPCVNCLRQVPCEVCNPDTGDGGGGGGGGDGGGGGGGTAPRSWRIVISGMTNGGSASGPPDAWGSGGTHPPASGHYSQLCSPPRPWPFTGTANASIVNQSYSVPCSSDFKPTDFVGSGCGGRIWGPDFYRVGKFVMNTPYMSPAGQEPRQSNSYAKPYTVMAHWASQLQVYVHSSPLIVATELDLEYRYGSWQPSVLRKQHIAPPGITVTWSAGHGYRPNDNWHKCYGTNNNWPILCYYQTPGEWVRTCTTAVKHSNGESMICAWNLPLADLAECNFTSKTLSRVARSSTSWNPAFAGGVPAHSDTGFINQTLAVHAKYADCPPLSCTITSLANGESSQPQAANSGAGASLGGVTSG